MPALYTASATATGDGRDGRAVTSDGLLDVDLAVQKELGGTGGATNPEQLFAAGWAACFHSALKLVARREKAPISDTAVTAEVGIGPNEAGGFALEAVLTVEIGGVEQPVAERLVAAAHEVCPYSNATRGNVPTDLKVVTA
ncbi:organic hydroperoxide resistance protein [Myceligenerans halotolerans]